MHNGNLQCLVGSIHSGHCWVHSGGLSAGHGGSHCKCLRRLTTGLTAEVSVLVMAGITVEILAGVTSAFGT